MLAVDYGEANNLSAFFEIYINEHDKLFSLPIHKTYKKLFDYSNWSKYETVSAQYNYNIDWGDNTFGTLTLTNDTNKPDYWNNNESDMYYGYLKRISNRKQSKLFC
jgi:hypothetical protein